jgi:hypothetical protein
VDFERDYGRAPEASTYLKNGKGQLLWIVCSSCTEHALRERATRVYLETKDIPRANSVLQALENTDPVLALTRTKDGGDLIEKDQHGNVPLHYAAAYGYMDVLQEILARDFPVHCANLRGQTPLIYAMEYGQVEAAKALWESGKGSLGAPTKGYKQLVFELCDIGVNQRCLRKGEANSGFFQKNAAGEFLRHARAREIAEELNLLAGFPMMQRAAEEVGSIIGKSAMIDLSYIWSGVGEWMP